MPLFSVLLGIIFIMIITYGIVNIFFPIIPIFEAFMAGMDIPVLSIIEMRLRRIDPGIIIRNLVKARKAEIHISIEQLEVHYLAGGNVGRVIDALIEAGNRRIDLDFQKACALDLSGRNVLKDVLNGNIISD